jgi:hypothetical protein
MRSLIHAWVALAIENNIRIGCLSGGVAKLHGDSVPELPGHSDFALTKRSIRFDSSESHYPANFQTLVVLEVVDGIEMHSGQE